MTRWIRWFRALGLWFVLVGFTALGCSNPTKKGVGESCQATSDCADNLICQNQKCAAEGEGSTESTADSDNEPTPEDGEEPTQNGPEEGPIQEDPTESTDTEASTSEGDADGGSDNEGSNLDAGPGDSDEASSPEESGEMGPETSPERPQPPTGMFLRCTVSNSCGSGLQCVDGFCAKPCFPYSDPLDCPAPAYYVCSSKNVCLLRCRDSAGEDNTLLCPAGMYCASGICSPGATSPQGAKVEGDSCKPGECDGTQGYVCLPGTGVCVKSCDPRRAISGNPLCKKDEECLVESRFSLAAFSPLQGVCALKPGRKLGESCDFFAQRCGSNLRCISGANGRLCRAVCDVRKGASLNPTCNKREYCEGQGLTYPQGVCLPLPARTPSGAKGIGNRCIPGECDRNQYLFCDVVENKCAKVCSPKDGITRNSLCPTTEVCVDERTYNTTGAVSSFLGGRCMPPATQKLGEGCDSTNLRCRSGLLCHNQRCYKACDATQGKLKNPDCSTTAAQECVPLRAGAAICQTVCDPNKGLANNASCAVGQYCNCLGGRCCSGGACPDVVYCAYSGLFANGRKRLGDSCSNQDANSQCDVRRSLFCRFGQCETACDPRKGRTGNPNCSPTQECVTGIGYTESSPLQGMCVAKGTQDEGKSCDSTNRCADPLVCVSGKCEKTCDPSQGVVANTTCAFTHYCKATLGISDGGVCSPLPQGQTGKRELNKSCTNSFSFPTKSCDKSKGLSCDENIHRCAKACQPRDGVTNNPKCSAGEECVEDIQSFLGGLCVAPASRKAGEWCNSTSNRCGAGLVCEQGLCQTPCDPTQGVSGNPSCSGSSFRCRRLPGFGKANQGVCVSVCNPSVGVVGNSACNSRQICVAEVGSQTSGFCTPVAAPENGPRLANDSCKDDDPDLLCGPNLVCATFGFGQRCTPVCDRRKGTQACNSLSWVCLASTRSSTGGYCSPPK